MSKVNIDKLRPFVVGRNGGLLADITSGDPTRVWSSSCEIIKLRDPVELGELAANLSEIRQSTEDLTLGGAFVSNDLHLSFAIRKLEYFRDGAGCLCHLYPEYPMYNPVKEAEVGNIGIDRIAYFQDSRVDAYLCSCTSCGTHFRVEEREGHYTWWGWTIVES
jgi:hypothetical protein